MKKISLIILTLALTTIGYAQGPKFGLKAGVNIASTSNTVEGESGTRTGFHAGLLSHIHLSPSWAIQPEVVYSSQGGEVTLLGGQNVRTQLNYVNIPLMVQYMFDNGFRLQAGPQVGFLTSVKTKQDGSEVDYFSTDDFKSTDVGVGFGLGYLSQSGFGIDGRYNLGLTQINDIGAGKTTNRVFQVGVFYMFDNGHKTKSR